LPNTAVRFADDQPEPLAVGGKRLALAQCHIAATLRPGKLLPVHGREGQTVNDWVCVTQHDGTKGNL